MNAMSRINSKRLLIYLSNGLMRVSENLVFAAPINDTILDVYLKLFQEFLNLASGRLGGALEVTREGEEFKVSGESFGFFIELILLLEGTREDSPGNKGAFRIVSMSATKKEVDIR